MQSAPNAAALRTPPQLAGGCGGFQRRSRTGGAVYGIPRKVLTPFSYFPRREPPSTVILSWRTGSAGSLLHGRQSQAVVRTTNAPKSSARSVRCAVAGVTGRPRWFSIPAGDRSAPCGQRCLGRRYRAGDFVNPNVWGIKCVATTRRWYLCNVGGRGDYSEVPEINAVKSIDRLPSWQAYSKRT